MCTVVKKYSKSKIAEEDIYVYKTVNVIHRDVYSSFARFKYIPMEMYETKIEKKDIGNYLDSREIVKVDEYRENGAEVMYVHKGFHSAISRKRLTLLARKSNSLVMRFRIPKGAKYIIGVDPELIVSDKIIFDPDGNDKKHLNYESNR